MIQEKAPDSTVAAVEKEIEVGLSVEEAFELFTEGVGTWWPLDEGHSIFRGEAASCTFEGRVGGKLYETHPDGSVGIWGTVQVYEPPHTFAATWHPGHEADMATYLEVRFTPSGDGTRVSLKHSGWEARGEDAQKIREGYGTGWDFVRGTYIERT